MRKNKTNLVVEEVSDKRKKNEKKFKTWDDFPDGSRKYRRDVQGRNGWIARYVKEVDANDVALKFYQEIYDDKAKLVQLHIKFPSDTGHQKL